MTMNKLAKSFGWAINGLRMVWHEEMNFRIEVAVSLVVIVAAYYFELSRLEWAVVIGCIGAVLASEIVNTAVEDLCNKVDPNTDPMIGKIKDIMGGFVLVVCFTTAIIGLLIFLNHL